MAAKIETLRIASRTPSGRRAVAVRLAAAAREWARKGQLGATSTSETRDYTGAR